MKTHAWIMFCFVSLFVVQTLTAEAIEIDHTAISQRTINYTKHKYGLDAARRVIAWSNLVIENKDKSIAEKLMLTNKFFNNIPIKSEVEIWGHTHWSTPFEMLARNEGSQADHVIGKYVTLEALGVPITHMHMTHVHSVVVPGQSYMVLTYSSKPDDMPLVLDTAKDEIRPGNERNDLIPEDSLNDDELWLSKTQSDGRNDADTEASTHVELWNEMNKRMDHENLSDEGAAY